MDANELTKECERMGISASAKHIENIQNLFEQLKKLEVEIEQEVASSKQAEGDTSNIKPKGGQEKDS